MEQNMTQQEMLDYIVDKFNLTMEFKTGQLEEIVNNICRKAVTWELVTSILLLFLHTLIIVSIIVIFNKKNKELNILKFLKNWMNGSEFSNINGKELRNKERKMVIYSVILTVVIVTIILLTPLLISELIDIIQCIAFPEKVVLEFIGQYI